MVHLSHWVVKRIRVFVHDRKEQISVGREVAILDVEGEAFVPLGVERLVLYRTQANLAPTNAHYDIRIAHSVRAQAKIACAVFRHKVSALNHSDVELCCNDQFGRHFGSKILGKTAGEVLVSPDDAQTVQEVNKGQRPFEIIVESFAQRCKFLSVHTVAKQ